MDAGPDTMLCLLSAAAGHAEACPGPACVFWEEGGAVAPAGCALERLGLELSRRPELTRVLLELRRRDRAEALSAVYRLADDEE
jgi:hypothetical protein